MLLPILSLAKMSQNNTVVEYRKMVLNDVAAVTQIESELARAPWSQKLFEDEFKLSEDVRYWVVAVQDETVVGFAGIMFGVDDSHILNLGVTETSQRTGIGKSLIEGLISESVNRGFTKIFLEVESDNSVAIYLYKNFGFEQINLRKDYYGKDLDASVMRLVLYSN